MAPSAYPQYSVAELERIASQLLRNRFPGGLVIPIGIDYLVESEPHVSLDTVSGLRERCGVAGCVVAHPDEGRFTVIIDAAVVDVLIKALEPDVLAEAVRSAVAELQADHIALIARRSTMTGELATIANRERRLLDALVDGDADASAGAIRSRLREELARRDALTAELARLDATPTLDADAIVADVQARAADLRGLLARHVTQARQVVRSLLEGRLACQPFEDTNTKGYAFTATGTYRRLGVPVVESVNVGGGPKGIRTRV